MNNPLIAFLSEILNRLFAKSPTFFKIWQWIFGLITAITGIPEILAMLHILLPSPFDLFASKAVSVCTAILFFFSKLPIKNDPVVITSDGKVITKTPENKLPFTEAKEKKEAIQQGRLTNNTLSDIKKGTLIFILISISMFAKAQITKPVPKPIVNDTADAHMTVTKIETLAVDSFQYALRPVVGVAAFSVPGSQIMTGAGLGYQKLKWNYETNKWNSEWSISMIAWAAGSVQPGPQTPAFAFGPTLGLFNNLMQVGGIYDFTHKQFAAVLSLGISLNN